MEVNTIKEQTQERIIIEVDFSDMAALLDIMEKYHDTNDYFYGKNDRGEDVRIGVWEEQIELTTYQANKWIRKNWFYADGTTEETFAGKW